MLYHVQRNGQQYGPYTLEDLKAYVASGNVLLTDVAKNEEMPDWLPVSQILNVAAPAQVVPYGGTSAEYPQSAAIYPDPPNLHWALVLLIAIFTCGLFGMVWMFVQAAWMRKVNPKSKALTYYIVLIVLYVITIVAEIASMVAARNGNPSTALTLLYGLCGIANLVVFLIAVFTMRSEMEEHFNGPEPIGLSLSGVMTFFFNVYYFQYHFTRINELKQAARYRGNQV
jgi:hypothetical protein